MINNDDYISPFPGTAVGKHERFTRRNPDFSESIDSSYIGRGPRGWRRSDDSIREAVSEALYRSPEVDARQVEVEVHDGIVFLTGSVSDRYMKKAAEECVYNIQGVQDVMNKISFKKL